MTDIVPWIGFGDVDDGWVKLFSLIEGIANHQGREDKGAEQSQDESVPTPQA